MRRMALPSKRASNSCACPAPQGPTSRGASSAMRTLKSGWLPRGRTCSTGTPAGSRRSRRCDCRWPRAVPPEWLSRSSMVRYEMQRRASSSKGATMACVGQAGMQAVQLPQCAVAGSSTGSGRSVRISPRKKYEPASLRDQVGVLADPAQSRIAGQRLFQHRARIHEHAVAGAARARRCPRPGAPAPGASPCGSRGPVRSGRRSPARDRASTASAAAASRRPVVHAQADHARGAGYQFGGPAAPRAVALPCSPSRRGSRAPATAAGRPRPPAGRRRRRPRGKSLRRAPAAQGPAREVGVIARQYNCRHDASAATVSRPRQSASSRPRRSLPAPSG